VIHDPDVKGPRQDVTELRRMSKSIQRSNLGRILPQVLLALIPLLASLGVLLIGRPSQSAVRVLVVIMFVCALALFFGRLRGGDALTSLASAALVLGFLFWYAYPALVTFFVPNYPIDSSVYSFVDDESIVKAIALLSLFLLSATLVLAVDQKQTVGDGLAPKTQIFSPTASKRLILIAVAACILGLLPLIILGGGLEDISRGIMESRTVEKTWLQNENLGNSTSPFTFIASSALIAGVALLWLVVLDRSQPLVLRLLIGAFALAVSTIVYFDQGTRANLVLFMMPAMVIILLRAWKRSRLTAIVLVLIAIMAGILALQFQTHYRSSATRDRASEFLIEDWYTLGGTLDFFSETVFAVSIVPSYHDYFKESSAMLFLVSPAPRFLWPGKPISELVRFYILLRWNIDILTEAGNTFPGIVGQYYMSWGWFGPILIGGLFGLLASRLDRYLARALRENNGYPAATALMLLSWMILCFRVLSPSNLYPVLFCGLIVWASRGSTKRMYPQTVFLNPVSAAQRSLDKR
jgi:oligosaccharide repeat unit polymerase